MFYLRWCHRNSKASKMIENHQLIPVYCEKSKIFKYKISNSCLLTYKQNQLKLTMDSQNVNFIKVEPELYWVYCFLFMPSVANSVWDILKFDITIHFIWNCQL